MLSDKHSNQKTNQFDAGLLIVALLTLFAIQPLLKAGLPTMADLMIHIYRTLEYQQAWAPGVIVPRWAPNLAYGYGYPLFIFAPPLPYLLALLLQLPGTAIETAFKALIILTFLLYAIGMYLLARDLTGSAEAGLVAATAYTLAPFALREALLYGGNLPQFLAIGLFPWPLWAITRATQEGSWGWTVLAGIFYAAIMLSHLFQVLIFTPVFGLYILLLLIGKARKTRSGSGNLAVVSTIRAGSTRANRGLLSRAVLFYPLGAIPLGLLLSAFFWIPVLTEQGFTRAQADIYLDKSPFFVRYPHWSELVAWIQPLDFRAANPYAPLTLGVITLILAGLGVLWGVYTLIRQSITLHSKQSQPISAEASTPGRTFLSFMAIFFTLVAGGAILMSLVVSRPVWEQVTILQVAEFPWRMLGLANLGLAILAGLASLWLSDSFRRPVTGLCLVIQVFAIAPYLYPVIPFTQHGQLTIADQITYERSSQSIGTTTLGEYLPKTVTRPPTTSPLVTAFQAGLFPERLDRESLPSEVTASLLEQTAVTHRYSLNSPTSFTLRLFHFDYPGWRADLDGRPISINPEAETGLMLLDIPAGKHILTLHFGETVGRLIGLTITGATLISLFIAQSLRFIFYPQRAFGSILRGFFPSPPRLNARLALSTRQTLFTSIVILITALWLKPLCQPFFTSHSPPAQALPAQYPSQIRFANGVQLVGYDLSRRVVQPGDYLQVVLYWQTDRAPYRVNLQPFVHLDRLDNFTSVAVSTNYTPGDVTTEMNMPTFHWDNSRYIRDEHDLTIPADTPPLAYAVRIGWIDPDQAGQLMMLADGSGDTAQLDTINVSPPPFSQQSAALAHPLNVLFSNKVDTIRLSGFEIITLTSTRLDFNLAWESPRRPQADYTIFAQLLDANRRLVASFDRPPLDGAYPTTTWLPNQAILDPRYIPLADITPGDYSLIVGLYDASTGQRLHTADGVDFVELSTITINNEQ